MQFYRIRNWQDIYEVNRTRELKSVKWIPLPVKLSGDGYCMLMEDEEGNKRKDGPAMFGTFIAIVELAAQCDPRGDLIRASGDAHDYISIGRICRIPPPLVERTISFCVNTTKWIEIIGLDINCGETASSCEIGADAPVILSSVIPVLSRGGYRGGEEGFENSKYGKRSKIKTSSGKLVITDPLWVGTSKEAFEEYIKISEPEWDKLTQDLEWIDKMKTRLPYTNIRESMEASWDDYWGAKDGWENKKEEYRKAKRKAIKENMEVFEYNINWSQTIQKTLKFNRVPVPKGDFDREKFEIEQWRRGGNES